MPGKAAWFERKFDFDFPAGKYPDILERLRGTPIRVEERVRSFPPEILTRRDGDTWSIQENVGHFIDVEALWTGRLDDFLAAEETLRPADLTNRKTHEADHNAVAVETLMASFRAAAGLHKPSRGPGPGCFRQIGPPPPPATTDASGGPVPLRCRPRRLSSGPHDGAGSGLHLIDPGPPGRCAVLHWTAGGGRKMGRAATAGRYTYCATPKRSTWP